MSAVGVDARASRELVTRLMDGYLSTQMVYVAVRLGIADALSGGPRSYADLAAIVGAVPDLSLIHI